jgi:hypothetical protein
MSDVFQHTHTTAKVEISHQLLRWIVMYAHDKPQLSWAPDRRDDRVLAALMAKSYSLGRTTPRPEWPLIADAQSESHVDMSSRFEQRNLWNLPDNESDEGALTILDDADEKPSANEITQALLASDINRDIRNVRELILKAEDISFTVAQSERLATWLLYFAEQKRDSSNPCDQAAVWSAIRTGASMLRSAEANRLLCLLEPQHPIETSLVTVKMIGRIFEAQPPSDLDQHHNLARAVRQIADSLLNPYSIAISQSAAMAQLALYALAAMASSDLQQIAQKVQYMGINWFTKRAARKLCSLRDIWGRQDVAEGPRDLLEQAHQILARA